jgi:hypothetical protein
VEEKGGKHLLDLYKQPISAVAAQISPQWRLPDGIILSDVH